MNHYEHGKPFNQKIKGEAKELPDIGYPIPDYRQNSYELERLNTRSFDIELKLIKQEKEEL